MEPAAKSKAVLKRMMVMYRETDVLWNHKNPNYLKRKARDGAYEKLLDVYRKIDPHATIDRLKKKIEHLRASFKREHKKVQASIDAGGEVHQPSLWYYNYLIFLADDAEPSVNAKYSDDDESGVDLIEEEERRAVYKRMLFMYRDTDLLWNRKNTKYLNHTARFEAYEKILEVYQKIVPHATVDSVKRKFESFRGAFKREHNKVQASMDAGGEVHRPSLWYYNYLTFLADDVDTPTNVQNAEDVEFEDERLEENSEDTTNEVLPYYDGNDEEDQERDVFKAEVHCSIFEDTDASDESEELPKRSRPSKRPIKKNKPKAETQTEGRAEAFGRSVAAQLKECAKVQRCIAEKLIAEVIFYADLGQLSLETKIELNDRK